MKYENPIYSIKVLEAKDILTKSDEEEVVEFLEINENQAQVSASANDVLGE